MTILSRREFFKRIPAEIGDQLAVPDELKALLKPAQRPADWHPVARAAELAPGTNLTVKAGGITLRISSSGEGIRALATDGTSVALRAVPGGGIEANPSLAWPRTRMLSHLSSAPVEVLESIDSDEPNETGDIHD